MGFLQRLRSRLTARQPKRNGRTSHVKSSSKRRHRLLRAPSGEDTSLDNSGFSTSMSQKCSHEDAYIKMDERDDVSLLPYSKVPIKKKRAWRLFCRSKSKRKELPKPLHEQMVLHDSSMRGRGSIKYPQNDDTASWEDAVDINDYDTISDCENDIDSLALLGTVYREPDPVSYQGSRSYDDDDDEDMESIYTGTIDFSQAFEITLNSDNELFDDEMYLGHGGTPQFSITSTLFSESYSYME